MSFSAVLFCPVCCSTIDVTEEGEQELQCVSCETEFKMKVDPKVIAAHSMVG